AADDGQRGAGRRLEPHPRRARAGGPEYFSPVFPIQMTGGSMTTWSELDRYRQVGAMARSLLVSAAAAQWGVAAGDCHTENGWVICGDKRASYGSLAEAASKLPAPGKVELKD